MNIDLDSPVREEISFGVSSLQILLWTTSTADMPLAGNGNSADGHRRAVEYGTAYGGTLSLYRSYIARATPPRAPSFLA
ncbi:MAG: hypothetical protein LIO77_05165 [Rikenellaceae bacterium]|nr:hypothetical protein [Rikenellaceae bacterium]